MIKNSEAIKFVQNITNHKGNDLRKFKNTLIFLTLDETRLKNLIFTTRELLGWENVENKKKNTMFHHTT